MYRSLFAFLTISLLHACGPDETISGFAEPDVVFQLIQLNGSDFTPIATITFPEEGKVSGQAPCNQFHTTQTAPYPWFALEPIISTRMICPDDSAERAFFDALQSVSIAEISEKILILSHTDGTEMVFQSE